MNSNPYTLIFGKEPGQVISRPALLAEITETFKADPPSQQIFIITGVRGSGKTVLMTEAARKICEDDNWITVELNPERDMLLSLASKLSSENNLAKYIQAARINLSFFGFGLEVTGAAPITDIETALSRILESIKKHGKKVLITVDDAANTANMKVFASAFQILLRQDLPVFLLITGLYENINSLQNEKTLTFLYRAPRLSITPLNIGSMADNYVENIGVSRETALKMARLTEGYSFAFQVLGFYSWAEKDFNDSVVNNFKVYLEEYVYEKIWSELSLKDRKTAYAIALSEDGKIEKIRKMMGVSTNEFNPYRSRLIKKGLISGEMYGYVLFVLPLFDKFILENYSVDFDK